MARARTATAPAEATNFDSEFKSVNEAITELETNKAALLDKAFADGGANRVVEVVNEIETLKDPDLS